MPTPHRDPQPDALLAALRHPHNAPLLAALAGECCPVCGRQDAEGACCVAYGVAGPPRIVRLSFAMDALLADPDLRLALDDLEGWAHTPDHARWGSPTMSARGEVALRLHRFAPAVEDVTAVHALYATTASASYDGFGTRELDAAHAARGGWRLVAVTREYEDWQTTRYASGGHAVRPVAHDSMTGWR